MKKQCRHRREIQASTKKEQAMIPQLQRRNKHVIGRQGSTERERKRCERERERESMRIGFP
eukprot:2120792-Pleurochrysis_carterae.AAC.1